MASRDGTPGERWWLRLQDIGEHHCTKTAHPRRSRHGACMDCWDRLIDDILASGSAQKPQDDLRERLRRTQRDVKQLVEEQFATMSRANDLQARACSSEETLRQVRELAEAWALNPHPYGPDAWAILNSCANDLLEILDK